MFRINFPLLLVVIALSIGIVWRNYVVISEFYTWVLLTITTFSSAFFWYRSHKNSLLKYGFISTAVLTFISIGMILVHLHDPRNQQSYYRHQIDTIGENKEKHELHFYIDQRLKPSPYYERYMVQIITVNAKQCFGKLLCRIPKSNDSCQKKIGTVYTTIAAVNPVFSSKNPGQFDHAAYLARQYIYDQFTVSEASLLPHTQIKHTLHYHTARIRNSIRTHFAAAGFTTSQLSIMNALLLGQRQDISPTLYAAYRDAGALHVLAISGLHIGILLGILHWLLHPLTRLGAYGKTFKICIIILILWGFAVLSGLSISVVRAVLMFSCMSIGLSLRSIHSVYNGLIISAGIIICLQPLALFDVGFQLSYIAVFGILWIQPILYRQFQSRWYLCRYIWKLMTVTLAAQLAILPLTLLYFHQFPVLFLLSNLALLPVLGVILTLGILCVLGILIGYIPSIVLYVFGKSISYCNTIVTWVANQETAVLSEIPCTLPLALFGYGLIIAMIKIVQQPKGYYVHGLKMTVLLFCTVLGYTKYQWYTTTALYIHHHHKHTLISIQERGQLYTYSSNPVSKATVQHILTPLALSRGLVSHGILPLQHIYHFKTYTMVIIDKNGIYPEGIQAELLLLSNTPNIHLDRVLDTVQPKCVVATASTPLAMIHQWQKTCAQRQIQLYTIHKNGYFTLQ